MKKEVNPAKSIIELAESYTDSPGIRALCQLIPFGIGSAFDVGVTGYIEQFRQERAKVFFDELAEETKNFTDQNSLSDSMKFRFYSSFLPAINARRVEKTRNFARLFKNSITCSSLISDDDFEDFVSIIETLSYREFQILLILLNFEEANPREETKSEVQMAFKFWKDFLLEVESATKTNQDEVGAYLLKISRTGCCEVFTGAYTGYKGGMGRTTPTFKKLLLQLGNIKA
jgi:hypothetical protein